MQAQILSKFSFGLKRHGYLFLGSSENISPVKEQFNELNAKWKIFQSIQIGNSSLVKSPLTSVIPIITPGILERRSIPKNTPQNTSYTTDLVEAAFSESGLCGVSTDENFKVTQAFSDLSSYLKLKLFNLNLPEQLPEPLAVAFSAAVRKAIKSKQRVKINNILYTQPGSSESQ